ncbi:hypothetical protein BC834DRAFT_861919 [Gloeopeniophorella convolvens]|nr:hypothetical protein BC834DRAFT_861919 [Gloeopeniophorella convolvens]
MHSPSSSFPPSPSFLPVPNVENVATFGGERTRNEREVPKDLSNVSDRPLLEPSFTLVKRPSFITMKENVIIEGRPSKMILDCRSGRISLYPMEADEVDYLLDSLEVPVELDPSPKTPTPVTPMKPDALDSEVTEAKLREFERISSHLRRTPSTPTPLSRVLPATYGTPMPIRQMHVPVKSFPLRRSCFRSIRSPWMLPTTFKMYSPRNLWICLSLRCTMRPFPFEESAPCSCPQADLRSGPKAFSNPSSACQDATQVRSARSTQCCQACGYTQACRDSQAQRMVKGGSCMH